MFKVVIFDGTGKVAEKEIHNFHQLDEVEMTALQNAQKLVYVVNNRKMNGKKEFDAELAKTYLGAFV